MLNFNDDQFHDFDDDILKQVIDLIGHGAERFINSDPKYIPDLSLSNVNDSRLFFLKSNQDCYILSRFLIEIRLEIPNEKSIKLKRILSFVACQLAPSPYNYAQIDHMLRFKKSRYNFLKSAEKQDIDGLLLKLIEEILANKNSPTELTELIEEKYADVAATLAAEDLYSKPPF